MQQCPKCEHELSYGEMSAGRCTKCGADLAPELGMVSLMASIDATKLPDAGEVPVYTNEQAMASLGQSRKPGTVGDDSIGSIGDSGSVADMTSDRDLPAPLRTLIDPDQTLGMNDEVLAGKGFDKTMKMEESSPVSDQPETMPSDAADAVSGAPSSALPVSGPPGSGSAASSAHAGAASTNETVAAVLAEMKIPVRILAQFNDPEDVKAKADYIISRKLGAGGEGEVWLAYQSSLNREVALKQILKKHLRGKSGSNLKSYTEKFVYEALVTGDLNHPYIVPIYDLGQDSEGNLLYSMKCVHGVSWDKKLADIPESVNIENLRKVAEAIAFAHKRGVVHRDLKPSNIMVGDFGEVLVMDWGSAFPMAHFSKAGSAKSVSKRAGTLAYIPPEQAEGDLARTGPHSDVYLLGAILFEIVAGVPPHPIQRANGESLTTKELLDNAYANRIVHTDKSGELLEIALKAMRTNPRDRYENTEKFIDALTNYQRHAESMVIAKEAQKDLEQARESKDYQSFARAMHGFENALRLWEVNLSAREGLFNTRYEYASAAEKKENYDLGLSVTDDEHQGFKGLRKRLLAGQTELKKRAARLVFLRRSAIALAILLFVGGSIFTVAITVSWRAQIAATAAEAIAKKDAEKERDKAREAEKKEQVLRVEAVKLKDDAVKAKDEAVAAKEEADKAREKEAEARKLEVVAKQAAEKAKDDAIAAQKKEEVARMEAVKEKNAADEARKKEEVAKKDALKAKDDAIAAQEKEKVARMDADKAKNEAEKSRDLAIAARNSAEREWYVAQVNLAGALVSQNSFDLAREIIKGVRERAAGEESSLSKEIGWELKRLEYVCGLGDDKLPLDSKVNLTAVATSRRQIATADVKGEIKICTTAAPNKLLQTIKTDGRITALAFSDDQQTLAVGNSDGAISLYNTNTGAAITTVAGYMNGSEADQGHRDEITQLLYLPEGQIVSTSRDHDIRVWDVSQRKVKVLRGHPDAVLAVSRIADPSSGATVGLLSGDANRGDILYWRWPLGEQPRAEKLLANFKSAITSLASQLINNKDGSTLLVYIGGEDGDLQVLRKQLVRNEGGRLQEEKLIPIVRRDADRHKARISGMMIDPNEPKRLITSSQDNTIRTWSIDPARLFDDNDSQSLLQLVFRGHGNAIMGLAGWTDEATKITRLVTASADGSARLWRPDVFPEVVSFRGEPLGHESGAYGEVLSVSVGGGRRDEIMGVSSDGVARIWYDPQKLPVTLHEGHRFLTQSAVFQKNNLVTVSFDGTAVVWDAQSGSMVEKWRDVGTSGVLAGSNDGRWVISGYAAPKKTGREGANPDNIQIWNLAQLLQNPQGDARTTVASGKERELGENKKLTADIPAAAAFSKSGDFGIIGTENGFVNLIDFRNGKVQLKDPTKAHMGAEESGREVPEGVSGVAFLSETDIVTSGLDGTLKFWQVENGELKEHPTRKTLTLADRNDRSVVVHRPIALSVSADGKRIAARLNYGRSDHNSDFRQIWVMDVDDAGAKVAFKLQPWGTTTKIGNRVLSVSLSPDGQKVLATVMASEKGSATQQQTLLREWTLADNGDPAPRDVRRSTRGFGIQQAAYLPGETDRIYVLNDTLTTVHRRTDKGDFSVKSAAVMAYGPMLALHACDLSRDGSLAVTISDTLAPPDERKSAKGVDEPRLQSEIRVWSVNNSAGQRVGGITLNGAIRSVAISPVDKNLILVGGYIRNSQPDGGYLAELYRWDGKNLVKVQSLPGQSQRIIRTIFSADGERIVTAGVDGQIEVYDYDKAAKSYKEKASFSLRKDASLGELVAVDLSDDGRLIVGADKSNATVVEADSGKVVINTFGLGHSNDLTDIRFAVDKSGAQRIWTTSLDGKIKFWWIRQEGADLNSARLLITLTGHQRGVLALASLPDGGVVTAGEDGQVIRWPIERPN